MWRRNNHPHPLYQGESCLMNSKKIILFIFIILLIILPFFDGGNGFFVRGLVFILVGLAALLFASESRTFGKGRDKARIIALQSREEYAAGEEDLNPLTSPFRKGEFNNAPLVKGGEGGLWHLVYLRGAMIFLFLYLLASLMAVFFSTSLYHSAVVWLECLSYGLLFFTVAKIKLEKKEIGLLIKIFLAISGLLCLIGIYFYVTGSYSRLTSLFWWPNPFAGYLLFSLFLGLEWLLEQNCHCEPRRGAKQSRLNRLFAKIINNTIGSTCRDCFVAPPLASGGTPRDDSKIFPILFLSIILSSFILTGSRGAFLSFVLALPVYFYFKFFSICHCERSPSERFRRGEAKQSRLALLTRLLRRPPLRRAPRNDSYKINRRSGIYFLSIIFLSLILIFFISYFKNDNFGFVAHSKNTFTTSDFSSAIRLNYWRGAWEMFKDRPLTGWGAGTFGTVYHLYQEDPISSGKYAHNLYLEILSEQGIFVFVFFILFLVSVLGIPLLAKPACPVGREELGEVAWRNLTPPTPPLSKGRSFNALGLFAGLVAFLIHNGVDIDWHFRANILAFWIFLGLFYNVNRNIIPSYPLYPPPQRGRQGGNRETPQPPFTRGDLSNIPLVKGDKGGFAKWILIFSLNLIIAGLIFLYSDYNFQRGMENQDNGNLILAEKYFFKSVFLNPNSDYFRGLGIILYSRAINIGGAEREALLNQALKISRKIIKYDSYNSLNYELAGRIYSAQGYLSEAEKKFKDAIRLDKFNPRHHINFASLLISEGKKEEARELINKILFYYPEEVVNNRKMYILPNQEITSGIEQDIEYLRYLLGMINR